MFKFFILCSLFHSLSPFPIIPSPLPKTETYCRNKNIKVGQVHFWEGFLKGAQGAL